MAKSLIHRADCHASGTVAYVATLVKGDKDLKICGHCLTHNVDLLTERGWDIHPLVRHAGAGVGTEGTPNHFALGTS